MNIRIPERIQMTSLLQSQPSTPIPLPLQYHNGIQPNIGQRPVYQNVQLVGPSIAYQSRPIISNTRIQNNYSPQRSIMSINNYNTQSIRTTDNRLNPFTNSQRYPKMRPDLFNMNHQVFNRRIENRPLSPKVQFKYGSPPKQDGPQRTQQIKQIKRDSNQQDKNKNLIWPNKSMANEQKLINQQQREANKQDSQIVVKSIENPMGANRNSINNFIYLLENQAAEHENEQKQQQIPVLNVNITNQLKQFKAEQALPSINNTLKKSKKQELLNKEKYLSKETKQQSNNTQKSYELFVSKNKTNSQELKQLETQYEKIKSSNNHNDSNYNYLAVDQDNQFPRVERNSSQEGESYPSKQGSRDTSKKNSILNNNETQYHGASSFGRLPEDERNRQKIIFNQAHSSRKMEANSNGNNRYRLEKQDEKKKIIKEEEQFIISGIEGIEGISGIENVKSQLIQGRAIDDNRQSQKEDEWQTELDIRLKQKDVQIKNLKNQIWMMKLRENELINQISKLQQANREQANKLSKLTKI